ncbi:hypothetical protein [Marinomonas foliarum]|uniref:Uncharacterized protein n=1 Tax=Marinomonas foliarum TaxID=491950 RepID=A0A369ACF7_9GAMM|nr:hypothetical protein [Marinomonas foliarum]RCX07042.1 hypothetical protein DFP77_107142 [Marinomonas foliarum]
MENQELKALLAKRKTAQAKLKGEFAGLKNISPMAIMTGGFKSLEGVAAQFESVAFLNDAVINELAERALKNG